MPWAIGAGLFLLGVLIGWVSTYMAVRPLLRTLPAWVEQPRAGIDSAWVAGEIPSLRGAPGQQLQVEWYVKNEGESTWAVDSYRFAPAGGGARVLALSRPVHAGGSLTVSALVQVPVLARTQTLVWELTGPDGKVEGGRLTVILWSENPGRPPRDPLR